MAEQRADDLAAGDHLSSLAALHSLWFSPSVDHRIREMFYGHSLRLMVLGVRLARRCRVAEAPVELAALAHDLGMTGIYSGILLKPDRLDVLEQGFIRSHVHSGAWICRDLLGEPAAGKIVLRHHERWDGEGYPDGLPAEEIPVGSRLLAVPDVFDTLSFEQWPYQEKIYTMDRALEEVRTCAGTQFDPQIVDELVLMLTEDPELRDPDRLDVLGEERMEEALDAADEDSARPGSDPDAEDQPQTAGGGTA